MNHHEPPRFSDVVFSFGIGLAVGACFVLGLMCL